MIFLEIICYEVLYVLLNSFNISLRMGFYIGKMIPIACTFHIVIAIDISEDLERDQGICFYMKMFYVFYDARYAHIKFIKDFEGFSHHINMAK